VSGSRAGGRAVLEDLLASLCASETAGDFIARWGSAGPSPRSPRGLRVEPDDPAISSLEVRPWDGGRVGVVDVELAPAAAPSWDELGAWFGPFVPLPTPPEGRPLWSASWWRDPLPVDAVILVPEPEDPGGRVPSLTLRRGSSRPR
jgi:hypothetical protein